MVFEISTNPFTKAILNALPGNEHYTRLCYKFPWTNDQITRSTIGDSMED